MGKNSAFANLGWTFSMMDQEGTLNWDIREFAPTERFGSAMVSRRKDSIKAFAKISSAEGLALVDVELEWRVSSGQLEELSSRMSGSSCDFGKALEGFQSAIAQAEPPVFAPSSQLVAARRPEGGSI